MAINIKHPTNEIETNDGEDLKISSPSLDINSLKVNSKLVIDSDGNFVGLGFLGSISFGTGDGYTGSQGVLGYTGSRGLQGPAGAGYTGSRGITGFIGSQGILGYTGSTGAGYTGSRGITGFIGSRGTLGYTGSIGFTGSRGDTGFIGSQGIQGNVGYAGSRGYLGSRGEFGYTGSRGSQGDLGFTGSRGDDGTVTETLNSPPLTPVNGQMWFDTEDGTLKVYYDDGDTSQWVVVSGPIGPKGELGYTGSKGIGYTGSTGYSGSRGFSAQVTDTAPINPNLTNGYLWFNSNDASLNVYYDGTWLGATGPQGIRGYTGSLGISGYAGSRGYNGSIGQVYNWKVYTVTDDGITSQNKDGIIADTTGGSFTINLPPSPSVGDFVMIADGGDWSTNPLTVGRNGNQIEDIINDDLLLDIGQSKAEFVYDGSIWQVITNVGSVGYTGSAASGNRGFSVAMSILFG